MSILIYAEIPIGKLYFGVPRNLNKDIYVNARKILKASIIKEGLKNPLCCGNVKQDGTYRVNTGNQRLASLLEMGIETVPCIVCCKEGSSNNPKGIKITVSDLNRFFKSGIEKVHNEEDPECFAIVPDDEYQFQAHVLWVK
tara:strand:+ start:26 stop:448 length:423 start_codon:yes stop_codon:yes gene_type:complete